MSRKQLIKLTFLEVPVGGTILPPGQTTKPTTLFPSTVCHFRAHGSVLDFPQG